MRVTEQRSEDWAGRYGSDTQERQVQIMMMIVGNWGEGQTQRWERDRKTWLSTPETQSTETTVEVALMWNNFEDQLIAFDKYMQFRVLKGI